MANPLIPQGVLNRLLSSVTFDNFPALNVTASYLGRGMISIAFEGDTTASLPQATGVVQSPEPYQMATITINLIKSQNLANQYKAQIEQSTLIGDCTARGDAANLSPFNLVNCAIYQQQPGAFDGQDAGYVFMIRGTYYLNSTLFV